MVPSENAPARRPVELRAHRYAMPVVNELNPPVQRPRPSQRALVVASLLRCDREDRATRPGSA